VKVLLDTNVIICSLLEPHKISEPAARIMSDPTVFCVCSQVVFWEMSIKMALGKLPLPDTPGNLWRTFAGDDPARILMITPDHLDRLARLPKPHGDPFDRIMIAQALEEGWRVVSKDAEWDAYGVQRIW
jgi:PIN domain nuclease of toxin-antitoxin system